MTQRSIGWIFLLATAWLSGSVGCASSDGPDALDGLSVRLDDFEATRVRSREIHLATLRARRDAVVLEREQGTADWADDDRRWIANVPMLAEFGDDDQQQTRADRRSTSNGRRASARNPLPGFWETVGRDLRDLPGVFWEDNKTVFTSKSNLVILGLTYGASLAMQETGPDDSVEDSFREHSSFKGDFRAAFGIAGNPGTHFGLAGLWYLVGQQTQDEKTYTVATKLFRTLTVTGVATLLGQAVTWDKSPNGEWGAFPSGHASSSFAFASVMHREYGLQVGAPLYILSTLVAWGRLEDGEHYLSDVVMGSVMGLVIGHTIAGDGEPISLFGGEIKPFVDPASRSTGLAWVKHFR